MGYGPETDNDDSGDHGYCVLILTMFIAAGIALWSR